MLGCSLKARAIKPERETIMRKSFTLLRIVGSLPVAILFCAGSFSRAATPSPAASVYHVIKTVPVGGEGGWDYVYVDGDARRVYISRGTHVVVLDADSYAVVGDIPDTHDVHARSEEHTSELQSHVNLVCRLLLEKKKKKKNVRK